MENLEQVVRAKIAQKLRKGEDNVQKATQRLIAEGKMQRDFVFEIGAENKGHSPRISFTPDVAGGRAGAMFQIPDWASKGPDIMEPFHFNRHSMQQMSGKLKLPTGYVMDLLEGDGWQVELAYQILNQTNTWYNRDNVLIRAVGNEVRGVLSDQYRILDSGMIFGTHIDSVFENGARLSDGYMDDTRLMVESLLPEPIALNTELNGLIMVAFGTRLESSDYGARALSLRSFILQGICLNGMVRESVLREVHLGAKLPQNVRLSPKTYELDSATTASAVFDLTKNLYANDTIKNRMLEIKAATEYRVDAGNMLMGLQGLNKILKGESEEIGKLIMANRMEDGLQGESTLWKMSQAITAYANREDVSDIRRFDLQEIAGDLFDQIKKN